MFTHPFARRAILAVVIGLCLAVSGCGSKITRANADKITTGMTEKEVSDLLGAPTEVHQMAQTATRVARDNAPPEAREAARNVKLAIWRDGNKVISVTFADSKVATWSFTDIGAPRPTAREPAPTPLLSATLFEQSGTFVPVAGEDGVVNFPLPYALPPNVEISGPGTSDVVVKEATATGFKWKCVAKSTSGSRATWTAKGIKATRLPEVEKK